MLDKTTGKIAKEQPYRKQKRLRLDALKVSTKR
jgi:hypothetical protein